MTKRQEQRHFTRVPFDAHAALIAHGGRRFEGRLLDLSLKGALLDRPSGWDTAPGEPCELEIRLGEAAEHALIRMQGRIAHLEETRLGLCCEQIDLESISHLRRLLELNLGDARLLERELAELAAFSTPRAPPPDG